MNATTHAATKEKIVELTFKMLEARKNNDVENLQALYHQDCVIEYPPMGLRNKGRQSVRAAMALHQSLFKTYDRVHEGHAVENETLVSWSTIRLTLTGDFNGVRPNGKTATLKEFLLLKFSGDTIIYEGHFWDQSALCQQSGIPLDAITKKTPSSL